MFVQNFMAIIVSQNKSKLCPAGGTRGKVRRSLTFRSSEDHEYVYKFDGNQSAVEIFQSGPKLWIHHPSLEP